MKKLLSLLTVSALVLTVGFGCGQQEQTEDKGMTLLDRRGAPLCTVKKAEELYGDDRWAFLEVAVEEAAAELAKLHGTEPEQARQLMIREGYQVKTTFDPAQFALLQGAVRRSGEEAPLAIVLTDLNGDVTALYSSESDDRTNHAASRYAPCSAFKALSVYTPAVEKGLVNWSSVYEDAPVKKLADDSGKQQDWPANASGTYSNKAVPVYEALRTSLNTVAVRCLQDVGVAESVSFLQTAFDIPLKEEAHVIQAYGEEEVLGSVALGYLETGITPVDMAGYYQIFATGGAYVPAKTVLQIDDADGKTVYLRSKAPKQVVSPETADVMNYLLRGVLKPGGTGAAAACPGVEIAGKTGTGDNHTDNWFVGVTPAYSCAVWHGQSDSNRAEELFGLVTQILYGENDKLGKNFITHKNLQQIAYCAESGHAFSAGCKLIELGYYKQTDTLPTCGVCGK